MNKQVRDILGIDQDFIENSKLHLAVYNEAGSNPYDVFCESWNQWANWTRYKPGHDTNQDTMIGTENM